MDKHRRRELLGFVALLACAGCATTNVLVQAPEEFWQTLDRLLAAIWDDVSTFLLVLGL